MLRLKQNMVGWMMDLVTRFCGPGEMVVDFCTGTVAEAKTYLLLSEQKCFVGCKIIEDKVKEALPFLAEVYARQGLTVDLIWNQWRIKRFATLNRYLRQKMDGIRTRTQEDVLEPPD